MKHFLPIFKALEGTKYVVVGGVATVLNGYPRLTGDIDLVLDLSNKENCLEVLARLKSLQMRPRAPVLLEEFADSAKREKWIEEKGLRVLSLYSPLISLIEIDLFVQEPLPFEDLYKSATFYELEDIIIVTASIEDLITIKKIAARPKDLEDVERLELIKKSRDERR